MQMHSERPQSKTSFMHLSSAVTALMQDTGMVMMRREEGSTLDESTKSSFQKNMTSNPLWLLRALGLVSTIRLQLSPVKAADMVKRKLKPFTVAPKAYLEERVGSKCQRRRGRRRPHSRAGVGHGRRVRGVCKVRWLPEYVSCDIISLTVLLGVNTDMMKISTRRSLLDRIA